MVQMKDLGIDNAQYAMKNGDFPAEILSSNDYVVIILTQSWCPQWSALKHLISNIEMNNLDVFLFIYDESPIFTQFMNFKERTYNNAEIPYIRYYKEGKFEGDSNFIRKDRFLRKLGLVN